MSSGYLRETGKLDEKEIIGLPRIGLKMGVFTVRLNQK
jgi:hypothetical protein